MIKQSFLFCYGFVIDNEHLCWFERTRGKAFDSWENENCVEFHRVKLILFNEVMDFLFCVFILFVVCFALVFPLAYEFFLVLLCFAFFFLILAIQSKATYINETAEYMYWQHSPSITLHRSINRFLSQFIYSLKK